MQLSSSRHAAAQTSKPFSELIGIFTFSNLEQETLVLRLRGLLDTQPPAHPVVARWAETRRGKKKITAISVDITKLQIPAAKKYFKIVVKQGQIKERAWARKKIL